MRDSLVRLVSAVMMPISRGTNDATRRCDVRGSLVVDLSFWEKAKRYRRIAAFAGDDELARQPKPAVQRGGVEPESKKPAGHSDKLFAEH